MSSPDATVVVLNWNGARLLPRCLDAVASQAGSPFQTWVVDNGSTDDSLQVLAGYPGVRVIRSDRNRGYAGGNNLALREVTTPYAVLLNNDAAPDAGWLAALVAAFDGADRVGAVTSKVLLGDGQVQSTGVVLTADGYAADRGFGEPDDGRYDRAHEVFAACGAACAFRTAALTDVGLLDERFFLYYEDVDLSWRLRSRGWSVRFAPDAVVHHEHSATVTIGSDVHTRYDARNRLLCLAKNATPELHRRVALRHPLETASLLRRGPAQRHRARLRAAAYAGYLRLLPAMRRDRAAIAARSMVSAVELDRQWRGRDAAGA